MPKYTVKLDRENCVASVSCVEEDPKNWKLDKDNKIDLKNSEQKKPGIYEREIDESELPGFLKAAKACPVNIIHIYEEQNKKLI